MCVFLAAVLSSVVCSLEAPSGSTSSDLQPYSGELTKSEYNALTDEQKYQVANKLMGTIFKGVLVDDFFDISDGMDNLSLKLGDNM